MRSAAWWTALLAVGAVVAVAPSSGAEDPCVDEQQESAGTLKWAVSAVVFSASTAIATRTVDREVVGGDCVQVLAVCEARAADGSSLVVEVRPSETTSTGRFRGVRLIDSGVGTCASVRVFEGSSAALRLVYE